MASPKNVRRMLRKTVRGTAEPRGDALDDTGS